MITLFLVVITFGSSHQYSSYQRYIPNGDQVPHPCREHTTWPGVGHQSPDGGGHLNPFGLDLYHNKIDTGKIWSKTVCEADSDGDGLSNGQELGDPSCLWPKVNVTSKHTISHPGICDPIDSERCKQKNSWLKCEEKQFNCDTFNASGVKELTLRMPRTDVQTSGSRYMCTHFHVPLVEDHHIIAFKPVIDNRRVVHHIIFFGCKQNANEPETNKPYSCGLEAPDYCYTLLAWSVGLEPICLDKQIGLPIGGSGYTRFMIQMHWHNSDERDDYTDSSGVSLYYTPRLRPHNAAMLIIGRSMFELEPGQPEVSVSGSCTGRCTKREFTGPIYIYAVFAHMHLLGRRQKVEHYRNGKLINVISNNSFSFQDATESKFKEPIEFLPGDELKTTCTYDTTSRNRTTHFGMGTDNEMCYGLLHYFPAENVQSRKLLCFQWSSLPSCLINDFYALHDRMEANPLLKVGMWSLFRSIFKH